MISESLSMDDILNTEINFLDILPSDIDLVGAEVEMVDIDNRDSQNEKLFEYNRREL